MDVIPVMLTLSSATSVLLANSSKKIPLHGNVLLVETLVALLPVLMLPLLQSVLMPLLVVLPLLDAKTVLLRALLPTTNTTVPSPPAQLAQLPPIARLAQLMPTLLVAKFVPLVTMVPF